jgi:hypothetical protein
MKSIKMMLPALMGALALGIYSAQAQPTGIYLKMNVALTLERQALFGTNQNGDGKTFVSTINKMKVNNKAFLALTEEMFGTNWPAGARLEYEIGMGLVVADKTGTNVLFYCEEGVSNAERHAYIYLVWHNQPGTLKGKMVQGLPGSINFTSRDQAAIGIYYENFSDASVYTDLNGDGLNIEKITDKATVTRETSSWNETFTPFCVGTFGNVNAILTGKITAGGKSTTTPP